MNRISFDWFTAAGILLGGGVLLLAVWWFDPAKCPFQLCMFHTLTGLACPGCGATRATHELLHGRFATAFHHNPIWIGSLPLFLYMALSEWRLWTGHAPLPGNLARRPWLWAVFCGIAAVFFVVRNIAY